jgi:nitrile hydratase
VNNIHDMGGMHGFGPIPIEEDEPVFHENWESRAMAITLAMAAWGKWNIDASRYARERLAPLEYLRFSYYERWIAALADLLVETGLVSIDELDGGRPAGSAPRDKPPLTADKVARMLARGGPTLRECDQPPRFAVGEAVRTTTNSSPGHTRLPRYARGRRGEVIMHHGAHVFPDSNAHFRGEAPQHLYTVRFSARELWGPQAAPRDSVRLDLWESYLDPAE